MLLKKTVLKIELGFCVVFSEFKSQSVWMWFFMRVCAITCLPSGVGTGQVLVMMMATTTRKTQITTKTTTKTTTKKTTTNTTTKKATKTNTKKTAKTTTKATPIRATKKTTKKIINMTIKTKKNYHLIKVNLSQIYI